jgi:alpha-1,3-rhamnosyl/mannosyltransferase
VQQVAFSSGAHRFDVYHDTTGFPLRFAGPVVATVHDLAWRRFPQTHPRQRVRAYERSFAAALRRTTHFITVSRAIAAELVELFGVPSGRVTVTPEAARPVFSPREAPQCAATLAAHGLSYRGFLLSVGTLEPRKNIERVLAAYSGLGDGLRRKLPLVLVGMRGWLAAGLEGQLAPLVHSGEVRVLGYVDDVALAALYASTRMLIYPSLYEGFGLPPLEAMASGTPVIVSNASSLPEVVGDAGIQVDPHDVDALRSAVNRLAEDDALWEALRSSGLARAAQFSWRRCAEETLAVYRLVAGRPAD